ncbi:MAG: sulfite exporter TauE/SafE family protein [Cycloclasticus sp.]|jgi:sulfite exporter TauE/SafE|nr:sulfite exporter TauE/SafE family protein [Cycloclasticus sp.]MDF1688889.1 sulfite exporter TauE/SafE family protein [Cycloclasticus sp.]MEE4290707.1 sulfite exporter TauE/SafE family protein [Cycloclasticus sp.]
MLTESTYFIAFIFGFLGSTHCVPMCGGIVGILSQQTNSSPQQAITKTLSYNAGRLLSYSFIGLLAGGISQAALSPLDSKSLMQFSHILTSVFMLAFGFYLLGWLNFLSYLERLGQRLWKHISPLGRRLLPIQNKRSAFFLGIIWGWLPCGLVYSALAWSLASADPFNGAFIMLCFGLGTLPMLLVMGIASEKLIQFRSSVIIRRSAGGLIIAFALFSLIKKFSAHIH